MLNYCIALGISSLVFLALAVNLHPGWIEYGVSAGISLYWGMMYLGFVREKPKDP